jgi:phosphate:Na+ symporter
VGFISAGLMTLAQSISVIMGANIGSTFTAQIVAFNVTQYALAMVAIGFAMMFTGKREKVELYGSMLLGLGLLFYGMGVMGSAMAPLVEYQPFLEFMQRMEVPILGILAGMVFTAMVQSSAATTGIAIVMASEGLVSLEAGIALALGANIGTCVTAVLAALGKTREAQRAAAAHVLFNVLGVLLWVGFIDQLAELVRWISPAHPELEGAARMGEEVPRQIANAHTVFNVANTLIFLPFTTQLARLVERLLPERPEREDRAIVTALYLDHELVATPALALERVRLELGHMGELVEGMLESLYGALQQGSRAALEEIHRLDDQVDLLHKYILSYLGEIRRQPLTDRESQDFLSLMSTSDYLESIGDVVEDGLAEVGHRMQSEGVRPSEATLELLAGLYEVVAKAVTLAVEAVRSRDQKAAQEVLALKKEVNRNIAQITRRQAERLALDEPQRPTIFRLEMAIVDNLKRIYTLSKRIAKVMVPDELLSSGA